jgi:hypothetical protein
MKQCPKKELEDDEQRVRSAATVCASSIDGQFIQGMDLLVKVDLVYCHRDAIKDQAG